MRRTIIASVLALGLAACGASPNNPLSPTGSGPVTNPANNVLQFAVGTANLYGTSKGLNVVVTYRQPSGSYHPGDSAALVSSPSIHIAGSLPATTTSAVSYDPTSTAWTAPGSSDPASVIASTSQNPGAAAVTTFGQSGGAFGIGIEPFNLYGPADAPSPSSINSPFQVAPYPVPLYNSGGSAGNPNVLEPWGGPPAFDLLKNGQSPVGNGTVPTGTAGISEGLDVFGFAPKTGAYSLSVLVATSSNGNVTQHAAAHLNAGVVLPAAAAATFTANGSGGGSLHFVMPAGATEAYIQVSDYGPVPVGSAAAAAGCNGATNAGPVIYYTIKATHTGTYTLPNAAGPGGAPSICSGAANTKAAKAAMPGDAFTVQTIAFDYPAYEASYPASLGNPKPRIKGSRGQDDVTISPAACDVAPAGGGATTACTLPFAAQPALARGAMRRR